MGFPLRSKARLRVLRGHESYCTKLDFDIGVRRSQTFIGFDLSVNTELDQRNVFCFSE
ncbi:hypothetical protein M595_3895 [Lyngbya aestuarii BL J]|uniref:Uncharacterized protein n=1 Tax=Lyngbya aestuarii BL J TaxID=1348334 RepID=U7QE66_9CYAN|nr:hypothetical protein M595_3895 [Lyngbya aestuarii BL J]